MPRSILIIKPDGLLAPGVPAMVRQLVAEGGLEVDLAYRVALSSQDVRDTWPAFEGNDHLVIRELLVAYMTSGQSEVLVVSGPDTVRACRAIRSSIRRTVGQSAIANGIHAPVDEAEATMNLQKYGAGPGGLRNFIRPSVANPNPGSFGRLAEMCPRRIVVAVSEFWATRHNAWRPAVLGEGQGKPDHRVELQSGDPRSIDFGLSCLIETTPSLNLQDAMRAYFAAELGGFATLVRGPKKILSPIEEYLRLSGLFATLKAGTEVAAGVIEEAG